MTFTTEIDGHTVKATILSGGRIFLTTEALSGQNFEDPDKLVAALADYSLKLRKEFPSRIAYLKTFANELPAEVEVTSLCENGLEAWIKLPSGRHSKELLTKLFASRDEVAAVQHLQMTRRAEIDAAWASCERWAPKAED
jgi:hypothetical protein